MFSYVGTIFNNIILFIIGDDSQKDVKDCQEIVNKDITKIITNDWFIDDYKHHNKIILERSYCPRGLIPYYLYEPRFSSLKEYLLVNYENISWEIVYLNPFRISYAQFNKYDNTLSGNDYKMLDFFHHKPIMIYDENCTRECP